MEVEFPQMLMPLMVATVLLFSSLLVYGTAMHLIVRVVVRLIRSGSSELGFWKSTAVMAIVTAITAAAHLTQIALWAVAFLLCGQVSTLETAFYFPPKISRLSVTATSCCPNGGGYSAPSRPSTASCSLDCQRPCCSRS